jgi:hypothetical protein
VLACEKKSVGETEAAIAWELTIDRTIPAIPLNHRHDQLLLLEIMREFGRST